MVKNSGRNPFTLSGPTQRLSAFPSPFTRKAELELERQYFTLAPGSDSYPSEDFTLAAGSVGPDNQAWIANWIYSTGDNMEDRRVSYVSPGSQGAQWKQSPSPTGTGSNSSHTYADDAYSVEPSSAGFDALDFTSISSPDTGRSFVPSESVSGSAFPTPLEETRAAQKLMNDNFSMFREDDMSVFAQQSQMMIPHSDMMDSQSLATTIADYGDSPLDMKLELPGPAMGLPSNTGNISTNGHFTPHYPARVAGRSTAGQFHSPLVSAEFLPHDTLSDDVPFNSIPWVENNSVLMSPSQAAMTDSVSHFDFSSANLHSEEIMSFFRSSDMDRKAPVSIAPRPPHSEDEPQGNRHEAEDQKAMSQKNKKNQLPRTDPLYQAKPDGDGYYCCPFIEQGEKGCKEGKHKPTKQKCTYDKYLDAHLKPYRCKHKGCENESFSSNAVLGRHLREMHDRASSPLCRFPDCKRGQPGCGFRRQYNCWDHERRVHKLDVPYTGTDRPTTRKRVKGAKARSIAMKKTTSTQSVLTTKSDPENSGYAAYPEFPEGVNRRQSFPSTADEVDRTPTMAYPDEEQDDQEEFLYDLGDDASLDNDEWFATYYNHPEMEADDDF